jgi:Xaa-Pro aminopeptidase
MIQQKEYEKRRKRFTKKLPVNSITLFLSATPKQRSHDTEYPYRQNSNFYYLSGFKEDNAALVFLKTKEALYTYFFVEKKDPQLELWNGKRLGVERAKETFAYDDIFTFEELGEKIASFGAESHTFLYDFQEEATRIEPLKKKLKNVRNYTDAAPLIALLRLRKSAAEIAVIKKALMITKEAHHHAMRSVSRLSYEYELQAEIEYIFKKNGAYSDAYTSIVACGNAANTLHYINNDQPLSKDRLILIDAGCEYEYYASDITRTIPSKGVFTKAQKELYALVLSVNKHIIEMIHPGVLRSELQSKSEELLCKGMLDLGILHGNLEELLDEKVFKKYYPHGIGHWMGLDVHDMAPYKDADGQEIPLKPGMVLTIEPGIYLDGSDKSIPKKYRGIGIRIEDDILVTKQGYENLSKDIVKEVKDIESFTSL